jgi:hypothetical protein
LYSAPAGHSRASGPPICSSPDPAEITTQLPGAMTRVTAAAMPQAVAVPGQPGHGPGQEQPVLPGSQRKQREQLCPDLIIAPARTKAPEPKLVRAGGTWVVNPRQIGGQRVAAAALQPNVAEISGVVMHDR